MCHALPHAPRIFIRINYHYINCPISHYLYQTMCCYTCRARFDKQSSVDIQCRTQSFGWKAIVTANRLNANPSSSFTLTLVEFRQIFQVIGVHPNENPTWVNISDVHSDSVLDYWPPRHIVIIPFEIKYWCFFFFRYDATGLFYLYCFRKNKT